MTNRLERPWKELSHDEAAAYLKQFLLEQPARLEELASLSQSTGGPSRTELDYGPESLVPLWRWARKRMSWHEGYVPNPIPTMPATRRPTGDELAPLSQLPSWVGAEPTTHGTFSPDTLWLIDMVARYFAEVLLRANPRAEWRVGNSRIKGYAEQNRPVLSWSGGELSPLNLITVLTSRELKGDLESPGGEALRRLFDVRMEPIKSDASLASEAASDELDLFDVAEYDPEGEWTYDIYLDDWFAAVGEDQVARLIADLSADPRIVEVHHEDREHLLVNAPDLTLDALQELVRTWFERHEDEIRETIEVE